MKVQSELGFGTSVLASFSSLLSAAEGQLLVETALDSGIRYFDTSNIYGQGRAEEWLGAALRKRPRDSFRLATKAGLLNSPKARAAALAYPLLRLWLRPRRRASVAPAVGGGSAQLTPSAPGGGPLSRDFSPAHLRSSLLGSLRRLRVDYVDDFFLHEPSADALTAEVGAELDRLKKEGLIRRAGVCSNQPSVIALSSSFSSATIWQTGLHLLGPREVTTPNISWAVNQVISRGGSGSPRERLQAALTSGSYEIVLFGTTKASHLKEAALLQG